MKRNFTRLLLSAVLMMCCTVMANAQIGVRGYGELVKDNTGKINGFEFALYKDYSYTYAYGDNVIKKSFSGNCAVVIDRYSDYSNIPSSVTYNDETYTVVALGETAELFRNFNLVIPNSVEVIECNAFTNTRTESSNSLTNLTFADGDKDLYCFPLIEAIATAKGGTFSEINTLKKLHLGRNLRYPRDDDNTQGSLAPFANGTFSDLEVTVGPNVTKIPDFCFYKASSSTLSLIQGVKTLNLSNATSLQSIGRYAFYGAPIYMALDFSKATSLQSIGDIAFANCLLLENIYFGDISLSYIGAGAFLGCTNLSQAFFFSNTPPTFGESCFPENTTVYVKNSNLVTEYSKVYDFKGKIIAYPDNMMLKYQTTDGKIIPYPTYYGSIPIYDPSIYNSYETGYGTMYFDHVLTSIGDYWFQQSSLFSISMPNTISSIGKLAFFKCTNLRTLVIPESVNNIGSQAFQKCVSLHDVFFLGNGNITVVEYCFENTPATIYVADTKNFTQEWDGMPVLSWRSDNGDGTKESPYEIENYINLFGFSLDVLKGNTGICGKLTADITGNANVLNEDGSLKEGGFKSWIPIGSWGSAPNTYNGYSGEFNGNGHTISGLYFNDETKAPVGLFGMADNNGYIHDVGIKDSYFRGKSHVAGICGDLGYGRIENCWNGATVISTGYESCAGGIAGSCWTNASMNGCYNIGNVSVESSDQSQCGGICGIVAKNANVEYSVSNCVSLDTKCSSAYQLYDTDAKISNVFMKSAQAFESGEACYILNGNKIDTKWRQQIGKDTYPVWTGNYLVNYYNGSSSYYYNETMCEHSANSIHDYSKLSEIKRCDGSTYKYWHCKECDKNYSYEGEGGHKNQTRELSGNECSGHLLELVKAAVMPTATTTGHYDYWHCTNTDCNKDFLEGDYHNPVTSERLMVPIGKNNEIWYLSTQKKKITPYNTDDFGDATYNDANNKYEYGLGKITFDKDVTSIGQSAFNAAPDGSWFNGCDDLQSISIPSSVTSIGMYAFKYCRSLQSINIPSGVTSIGESAFSVCGSLQSIDIPSDSRLTSIGKYAFCKCHSLQSICIPSGVTSIGKYAFTECGNMKLITFNSLPDVVSDAFNQCKISTKILDLTDSDKPYIGTSLANYPGGFTEAHYHRTLANDGTWGTIVLPFKPSAESTEGLKFYALQSMATGGEEGGSLTFMKVDAPEAGVPYLFRNEGESADFTLTAETPSSIILETQEVGTTDFKMKGSFQQVSLNTPENKNGNLYYLKDNEFFHANGKINIAPFRAYIEGSGTSDVKSFVLVVSDNGEDITAIPGIMDEDGTLDETEAIYDLSGRRLAAPVKGQINIIRTKSGKTIKRLF